MSSRISRATGNWLTAGTWGLVDATSELDSETGTTTVSTTNLDSAAFTPGTITTDGVALKLGARLLTTGTFTVTLRNSTGGVDVTSVTVNMTDFPAGVVANLDGGWIFFEWPTPVLLLGATNYVIRCVCSSVNAVSLYRDSTANNWSRLLCTTTTGAPAAGDKLIVAGELTGAGTGNSFTVTYDQTATTDYGTSSTTLASLAVANRGTLTLGNAASTAYNLKLSGLLIVTLGGTLNTGTVANPLPSTSSFDLNLDCAANVDFGILIRGGTWVGQGASKISQTLMTADKAAAATVVAVLATTGWVNGDTVAFPSTSRTATQHESRTITVDSGTQITLNSGFTNAHSGTNSGGFDTRCEVINLTRNIKIHGASASLQGYILIGPTATVDLDYVEFSWLGAATAGKRGIDIATTTGSCNINGCALHDFTVSSSIGFNIQLTSTNSTITNCVSYTMVSASVSLLSGATGSVISDYTAVNNTLAAFVIGSVLGTISNIRVASCSGAAGVQITAIGQTINSFSGVVVHSCVSTYGFHVSGDGNSGTISNSSVWRNPIGLGLTASSAEIVFDTFTIFGSTTSNIRILTVPQASITSFLNGVITSEAAFTTARGILIDTSSGLLLFENVTFGVLSAHTTVDIDFLGSTESPISTRIFMRNCKLASTVEVANQTNLSSQSLIASQKHDQTAGLHKRWGKYGTSEIDTSRVDVSPSLRLTPNDASNKFSVPRMYDEGTFQVAVASGTTPTISVKVRQSKISSGDVSDYNGARPRLILKKNVPAGVTVDTVLATATAACEGAFETISGAVPAPSGDHVYQIAVDCDGTTGWVNVDTFLAV